MKEMKEMKEFLKEFIIDLQENSERPRNPDGSPQIIMTFWDGRGDMVQFEKDKWCPLTPYHIEEKTLPEIALLSFKGYQEFRKNGNIKEGYNDFHKYISPGKVEKIDD
jgi:hypothetical protein